MARQKNRFNAIGNDLNSQESHSQEEIWRTALYARLSAENERNNKDSIETQLCILRSYLNGRKEFRIVKEYIDYGYSGTNFKRPAFEEMMEAARDGKVNCIITKDLSRLGRNYLETSNLVETIFPFLGVRYISVNDHFDTLLNHNGNKELEIALKNLVNDMYARDISKRLVVTRKMEQKSGKFVGSNAPYGYKIDEQDPMRHYVVDEKAAAVVRQIVEWVLNGVTLRKVSLKLQEQRLRIPAEYYRTGKLYLEEIDDPQVWYIGTISGILHNEAYIGNLVQGKRKTRLFKGEKQHFTDEDEWIIVQDAHEPIVSKEVFYAVRDMLENKVTSSCFQRDRTKGIAIKPNKYAGLLFCGMCGMKLAYGSTVPEGSAVRRYYFRCDNNYRSGKKRCAGICIQEPILDSIMNQLFGDLLRTFNGDEDRLMEISKRRMEKVLAGYQAEISRFQQKIDVVENESADTYEAYVLGESTREEFSANEEKNRQILRKWKDMLEAKETERDAFASSMNDRIDWMLALDQTSDRPLDADLLRILVTRINLYPGHEVEVIYPFAKPDVFSPEEEDV